jgi:hypothetical protein
MGYLLPVDLQDTLRPERTKNNTKNIIAAKMSALALLFDPANELLL